MVGSHKQDHFIPSMFLLALAKYRSMGRTLRHKVGCRWVVEPWKFSPTMPSGSGMGRFSPWRMMIGPYYNII